MDLDALIAKIRADIEAELAAATPAPAPVPAPVDNSGVLTLVSTIRAACDGIEADLSPAPVGASGDVAEGDASPDAPKSPEPEVAGQPATS